MSNARAAGRGRFFVEAWPLLPAMLFLVVVFVYPVLQILAVSFADDGSGGWLQNYARLFESPIYVRVLFNTFWISILTTSLCILIGYPLAYLLATVPPTTSRGLLVWILVPLWTSDLVRVLAWILILGRRGFINETLTDAGLTGEPLDLLYTLPSVLVGNIHSVLPIAVVTMSSVMVSIDSNLTKAANTLGARAGNAFWQVYFPRSLPGVAAAGLLLFISTLGSFISPTFLGSPREMMMAQVIIVQLEEMLAWGFAGAIAVLLLATTIVLFALFHRALGATALGHELHSEARPSRKPYSADWSRRIGNAILLNLGRATRVIAEALDRLRPGDFGRPVKSRRLALWIVALAVVGFLALPSFILIPLSFTQSRFFQWPPEGFSFDWYRSVVESRAWTSAALRSIYVGVLTATFAMVLSVPAAFVLVRKRVPMRPLVLLLLIAPLVLPHIIVAISIYYLYARIGLVGTDLGLVLGHTIFAVPYAALITIAVLRNYDRRLDDAASTLGARPATVLRLITFPLIKFGLASAFLLAFVRSFDELTIALFVSGNQAATLPRQIWAESLFKIDPSLAAVSTLLLSIVFVCVIVSGNLGSRRRLARG